MAETAIETPSDPLPRSSAAKKTAAQLGAWGWIKHMLTPIASLRLTVILFAFSIFLVFVGTLAQVNAGIWTVVNTYFRGFIVWIPLQVFYSERQQVAGSFPYPGGWLLGGLLLVNLLAAHAVRFKLSWKRSGILILHAGLIVMMLGELVAGLYQVEGQMRIDEGGSSNFVEQHRHSELAVVDPSDTTADDVVAIPDSMLRQGESLRTDLLPFECDVVRYMVNSELADQRSGESNVATAGTGLKVVAIEKPEVSGTSTKQDVDVPSAYVTFKDRQTGEPLGTYLLSIFLKPQPVEVNGKTYQVGLRFRRDYKPFRLHLIDFRFDRYLGTDKAKNFSSLVRLEDANRGENREILIRMNEPLRYLGETYYQADFDKTTERTTVLTVVRNPGWLMPYISCGIVCFGMLIHFSINLFGFFRQRAAL